MAPGPLACFARLPISVRPVSGNALTPARGGHCRSRRRMRRCHPRQPRHNHFIARLHTHSLQGALKRHRTIGQADAMLASNKFRVLLAKGRFVRSEPAPLPLRTTCSIQINSCRPETGQAGHLIVTAGLPLSKATALLVIRRIIHSSGVCSTGPLVTAG